MNLKNRGVFLFNEGISAPQLKDSVRRIENLGYGAVWFPEAAGREPFVTAAMILDATEHLIAATGIMNIYGRDATVTAMGQQTLAEMSSGRFLLGLGVSHAFFVEARGHAYGKPLQAMREYLNQLKAAHASISVTRNLLADGIEAQAVRSGERGAMLTDAGEMPVVLAALGPKMTEMAGQLSQGAHPYNTVPAHTRRCREILGPSAWLCPAQRVCLTNDAHKARRAGRQLISLYLTLPNYRNMLLDSGYTAADIDDGGSDRLIDQLVGWGDEEAIRAYVQAHLDAGADHVCVQTVDPDRPGMPDFRALEIVAA